MDTGKIRLLAWFGVIAGVCLNASTMLAQPVANSAAHVERVRLQWSWFASDVARDGDAAFARVEELPPTPSLMVFVNAIQPLEDRRPDTTGSTTGSVKILRAGDGETVADPGSLDPVASAPTTVLGDGPIEEITIRVQLEASWHTMTGEIHLRRGAEPVVTFVPSWRPLILMMAGVGLAMLVIGFLGLAMLRRAPADADAPTK